MSATPASPKTARPRKAPAAGTPPLPTPEEYRRFVEGVEIKSVALTEGHIKRQARAVPGAALTSTIELGKPSYTNLEKGFCTQATYNISLVQTPDGADAPEVFAIIHLTLEGTYASEQPMTDLYFGIFKQLNVPTNLWPYAREFVQSATSRMGLTPLVLPAYKS